MHKYVHKFLTDFKMNEFLYPLACERYSSIVCVLKDEHSILTDKPIFAHRCVFATKFQHLLSERLTSLGIMGAPRVPPLNP